MSTNQTAIESIMLAALFDSPESFDNRVVDLGRAYGGAGGAMASFYVLIGNGVRARIVTTESLGSRLDAFHDASVKAGGALLDVKSRSSQLSKLGNIAKFALRDGAAMDDLVRQASIVRDSKTALSDAMQALAGKIAGLPAGEKFSDDDAAKVATEKAASKAKSKATSEATAAHRKRFEHELAIIEAAAVLEKSPFRHLESVEILAQAALIAADLMRQTIASAESTESAAKADAARAKLAATFGTMRNPIVESESPVDMVKVKADKAEAAAAKNKKAA